ncbi:HNH endonuclease family protein [Nocardia vermiculata]|uniref:HNH endonuclease n=1 Tax=Nocardia vermiculata TaxID=257274 RepID=A0A846Y806_9NOCA|nr:HNH endonuclease family protein [Nocardia vermiculata]NKY53881.1 HNH endonuclease [Nocardia vermiculata]
MKVSGSNGLRRLFTILAPVVLAVVLAVAYSVFDDSKETTPDSGAAPTMSGKEVEGLLAQLKVGKEASMSGYSRDEFPHWDKNTPEHGFGDTFAHYAKCTTRDVMMLRDATGSVTLDPATCDLTVGKDGGWRDHYGVLDSKTGELKPYKWITNPSGVDAEHIVPLAEAWRSGAKSGSEDTRRNVANDAVNLVASDPSANRSKGDQDASDYLPPGSFRCEYVQRYIRIKVKYGLTIDLDEQTALRTAVGDCVERGEFT